MTDAASPGGHRVGVVVTQLGYGGAERQTFELLRSLKETPWQPVSVYCLSDQLEPYGPALEAQGYSVQVIARTSSYDPARLWRLRMALRRDRITLVHGVHLLASAYSWLAVRGADPIPVLPTMRATVVRPGWLRSTVYRRMFASSPRILANSHSGAEFLARHFGAQHERLVVVPNGLDFDGIRERCTPARLREVLGLDRSVPIIGFVGKNSRVKNVPRFIEVLRRLRQVRPDVIGVLIGHQLDPTARAALAPDLPASSVHFLGPRQDVVSLLAGMDALVLTSDSEGCPNVVLEAMAVGTPVVSANVGDVARMMPAGSGWVVPPADISKYVDALATVLTVKRSQEPSSEVWQTLTRTYGMRAMVDWTLEVWQNIADGRQSP